MPDILYVRYYPSRVLSEVLELSPLAELAHRRLCDALWVKNGSLPNDDDRLRSLCRISKRVWRDIKRELLQHGWTVQRNRFRHRGALATLRAAQELHAGASRRARDAARDRWHGAPSMRDACQPGIADAGATHATNVNVGKVRLRSSVKDDERSSLSAQKLRDGPDAARRGSPEEGDAEARFLQDVALVMQSASPKRAAEELSQWGGWWRNRFRENPRKARVVLGDIKVLLQEGRIRKCPGAAATDLWGRLP